MPPQLGSAAQTGPSWAVPRTSPWWIPTWTGEDFLVATPGGAEARGSAVRCETTLGGVFPRRAARLSYHVTGRGGMGFLCGGIDGIDGTVMYDPLRRCLDAGCISAVPRHAQSVAFERATSPWPLDPSAAATRVSIEIDCDRGWMEVAVAGERRGAHVCAGPEALTGVEFWLEDGAMLRDCVVEWGVGR